MVSISPPISRVTCPAKVILLYLITRKYLVTATNHVTHHSAILSGSLLLPLSLHSNISVNTLFSNTLGLHSSANVRDQILGTSKHAIYATLYFCVLWILYYNIRSEKMNEYGLNVSRHFLNFNLLLSSFACSSDLLVWFPNILTLPLFYGFITYFSAVTFSFILFTRYEPVLCLFSIYF